MLLGCYNEDLIDAIDINDPIDIALMVEHENAILEEDMPDDELGDMIDDVENGVDTNENDDMYETSTDMLDMEIDEDIEIESDLSDDIGGMIDAVDGNISLY